MTATPAPAAAGSSIQPLALSLRDAGAALGGVSRSHIYTLTRSGQLPTVKVGGRRLVRVADLRSYLDRLAAGGSA